jgi:hypothetical protein
VLSKRPALRMRGFSSSLPCLLLPGWAVKPDFQRFFQLAAVQTPVLFSPSFAHGWAVSAKHVAMQQVAKETWVAFERRLERAQVPAPQRPDYHKWTRFYLDFCRKYGHPPRSPTSLGPFLSKLAAKNQSAEQRHQAAGWLRVEGQATRSDLRKPLSIRLCFSAAS